MVRPFHFLFAVAVLSGPVFSRAETDTAAVTGRPFLGACLDGLVEFGASPLRLEAKDSAWLLPSVIGAGVLLNNDVPLYAQLAKTHRNDTLDKTMPAVSTIGEGYVEFPLAFLGYAIGSERFSRTSAVAMQGLAVVAVYSQVFKYAAWSNRPSQDDGQHRFLAYDQPTLGMPSGHSYSAFCLAEIYGAEYGRVVPYGLASLIAYSRIYNQAHWPSDVFVGSLLGVITGVQIRHLDEKEGAPRMRFSLMEMRETPLVTAQLDF